MKTRLDKLADVILSLIGSGLLIYFIHQLTKNIWI